MLSPRELSYADLPSKNWINEHLIYTHGYGLTLGVVNQVTPEGLPALLIQDIPPVSKTDLKVTQPEIYFGEIENDYIIVNSRQKEFNYPSGEQNVFASYQGKGGIPIGGFLKKALWSLRFGAFKILLSSDITPQSRILFDRSIRTRVQKLVPFLQVDQDPYLVVSGGRLYWILDAYALSSNYPYSRPIKKWEIISAIQWWPWSMPMKVRSNCTSKMIRTRSPRPTPGFSPISSNRWKPWIRT